MDTKKQKLLMIINDCFGIDPFDIIVIESEIFGIVGKSYYDANDKSKAFLDKLIAKYTDDLACSEFRSKILSACGAYESNSTKAINNALMQNNYYIYN